MVQRPLFPFRQLGVLGGEFNGPVHVGNVQQRLGLETRPEQALVDQLAKTQKGNQRIREPYEKYQRDPHQGGQPGRAKHR